MIGASLTEISQALADKKLSCTELCEMYLQRITQYNPTLNCFITPSASACLTSSPHSHQNAYQNQILSQAKYLDKLKTRPSKLTGIPIAHKDIFCTQGTKTSCGSKMLDNFISPYDATVVEKCAQAQLLCLGKTNMDEFAMGSSNENSFYGAVKNPWNLQKVPGGSSGGSAAAVAAGLVPAATGTDTGGSIRQPASFCGITGLKPTYGRVSRYGLVAFASSLDQAGPMARSAEDCALLLEVMAGYDPKDSTSVNHPVPEYQRRLKKFPDKLKIGIPRCFFSDQLNNQIATQIMQAIRAYEQQGATIIDIELPHFDYALAAYYTISSAECSSNLARFDGVRYGYQCENPQDLQDLYIRSRTEALGDEVKRRIIMGTYALSAGYYDAYYLKAQKIRQLIRDDFQTAFRKVDVIMGPTTPTVAFDLKTKTQHPVDMYLADIYTLPASLAGLPALSLPAGFSEQLPVGLQMMGDYFSEQLLLCLGYHFQQWTDWHQQQPPGWE